MKEFQIPIQPKRRYTMLPAHYTKLMDEATKVDNKIRSLFNNVIKELYGNLHYTYADLMDEYPSVTTLINVMTYFTNTIHIEIANDIISLDKEVNRYYRNFDMWTWTELMIELSKFSKKYVNMILPYTGVNLKITNVPRTTEDEVDLYEMLNDVSDLVFAFYGSSNTVYAGYLTDTDAKRTAELLNRDLLGMGYFKSTFIESRIQNRIEIDNVNDSKLELYFNISFGAIVDVRIIKYNCLSNRYIDMSGDEPAAEEVPTHLKHYALDHW